MLPRRLRLILGFFLMTAAVPLCLWGFWLPAQNSREVSISPGNGLLPLPGGEYTLNLAWTGRLRAGDDGRVQATLRERGLEGQVQWMVESRLELPGLRVEPNETQQSPRLSEEPVSFTWTIHSPAPGRYPGRVWIFVQPALDTPGGEAENNPGRNPLAALPVEVEVSSLLFLDGAAARTAGAAVLLAGFALVLWTFRAGKRRVGAVQPDKHDA